jgi:TIR domain/Pentapeptide repeats (8 copies)
MANQEQLDILKQGVEVWNQWREEHRDTQPNLRDAGLRGADLRRADLNYADLSYADLTVSKLNYATLIFADLSGANLLGADLRDANLSYAIVEYTSFGDVDLSVVKNLETVAHHGPSTIGIDTIYRSQGNIPEVFLKGAGVDDTFITYIRSLIGKAIEYYSCFISYSSKDEAFAKRLYADLQSQNVRCWFAPEDLKWGDRIRTGIDEAIRLHDKLLLILSKSSVASGWVEREVKTALAKERKEKRTVLFPVRVDKAVFESPFDWATEIRHERNIGDFTRSCSQ